MRFYVRFILVGLLHAVLVPQAFAQGRGPSPVAISEVIEREAPAGQAYVATVLPEKRVVIGSAVDGRVEVLHAQLGSRVESGEQLVGLLENTIRLELAAAEAELQLRRKELLELENGTRPQDLLRAEAQLSIAEAQLSLQSSRRERAEQLRQRQGTKAISIEEFEAVIANELEAKSKRDDAKAALDLAKEGPRAERKAQAEARVAAQKAIVDQINDRIKKYTMKTKFNGYVTMEHTEVGAWVKRGDPVMEVVALDNVEVQAYVAEDHVPFLWPDMDISVEVPALKRPAFRGSVVAIVPQADTQARTFPIRIRVKNEIDEKGPLIKAGMFARVMLPTGPPKQVVMAPKDALVLNGARTNVYVVDASKEGETGTVTPVDVELGVAVPDMIEVIGKLKPGQMVVVEGNERLRPGQEVVVKKIVAHEEGEEGER